MNGCNRASGNSGVRVTASGGVLRLGVNQSALLLRWGVRAKGYRLSCIFEYSTAAVHLSCHHVEKMEEVVKCLAVYVNCGIKYRRRSRNKTALVQHRFQPKHKTTNIVVHHFILNLAKTELSATMQVRSYRKLARNAQQVVACGLSGIKKLLIFSIFRNGWLRNQGLARLKLPFMPFNARMMNPSLMNKCLADVRDNLMSAWGTTKLEKVNGWRDKKQAFENK